MKISSASKKVLASALSAAMVVAFAPTVALAADATGGATLTYTDKSGAVKTASYDTVQKAVDEAAKANGTKTTVTLAGDATVDSDLDIAGVADGLTLDLAGHTISASQEFYEGNESSNADEYGQIVGIAASKAAKDDYALAQYTSTSDDFIFVKGSAGSNTKKDSLADVDAVGQYVVVDGDVYVSVAKTSIAAGTAGYYQRVQKQVAAVSTGKVTIKNGTIATYKAEKDYNGVRAAAPVVLDGVTIATEKGHTAVVATADVTVKGESDISAKGEQTTTLSAISAEAANVTVEAGKVSATNTADANGYVNGVRAKDFTGKGGTVTATSATDSNVSAAVRAKGKVTISGGTYNAVCTTATNTKIKAVYSGTDLTTRATGSLVSAGTFEGDVLVEAGAVKGGTFSQDMTAAANKGMLATGYAAKDDGSHSVVYLASAPKIEGQYKGTIESAWKTAFQTAAGNAAVKAYNDIMDNAVVGETVSYELASGYTKADVAKLLADENASKNFRILVTAESFSATDKNLSDAQKAALETAKAAAAKDLKSPVQVLTTSASIQYRAAGERDWKDVAVVTDMGSKVSGRTTTPEAIELGEGSYVVKNGALVAIQKNKAGKYTTSEMGIFATTDLDAALIKDATQKPAAEKATQGIDVAKKSKTVKLAKKAFKTKKAQSFNMGVSAQTAVTTAKASGSKYVTVKGGKVTLKKGVKKGTYKAKVTINAAASDAYLAAAKTVTVTFKVTK